MIASPINTWKPLTRPQEVFLGLPDDIKEAFFGGSAGPGKSECLMMYPIVRKFYEHPRFKALYLRRTYGELENEIIPRSRILYEALGAKLNESKMYWKFPSGALIFFGHCEHSKDVHKYDSMEINLFLPDELESFLEEQYIYIGFQRTRSNIPELPAIIRGAGMPGGIGHNWVKKRFIDPNPHGGVRIIGRGGNERIYIHSTIADLPADSKVRVEYGKTLDALPEAERKAKKFGDWSSYEGQVFDEYRDKPLTGEPENAQHLVKPFDIPDWWPRIVSIDWGMRAMCSIGHAAISPRRRVYVYRHQAFFGKKIEIWAPEVKYFVDKENPADIVICHSAGQDRGTPHTILQQVEEALGCALRLGEKDRIGGKQLVHEYLRWETKKVPEADKPIYDNELANWILRNKGDGEYQRYLSIFQPSPSEDNLPRLLFFDDELVKMIPEAIKSCVYQKTTADGKKVEDVAEFDGDDPYDMLRMLLHAADRYFELSADLHSRVEKIDGIVNRLAQTNDWNTYYREMKKAESFEVYKPISRFHKGNNAGYSTRH